MRQGNGLPDAGGMAWGEGEPLPFKKLNKNPLSRAYLGNDLPEMGSSDVKIVHTSAGVFCMLLKPPNCHIMQQTMFLCFCIKHQIRLATGLVNP